VEARQPEVAQSMCQVPLDGSACLVCLLGPRALVERNRDFGGPRVHALRSDAERSSLFELGFGEFLHALARIEQRRFHASVHREGLPAVAEPRAVVGGRQRELQREIYER
jgi:hypothetical protein